MGADRSNGMGEAETAVNIQASNKSGFNHTSEEFGVEFYLQLDPVAKLSIGKLRKKLKEVSPKLIEWSEGRKTGHVKIPGTNQTATGVLFSAKRIKVTKEKQDDYDYLVNKHLDALRDRLRGVSAIERLKVSNISQLQNVKVVVYTHRRRA